MNGASSLRAWRWLILAAIAVAAVAVVAGSAGAVVETEPNDAPDSPNDVLPGETATGYAPAGDLDYWSVNVSSPGVLQVILDRTSECWTLRIAWANNTTATVGLSNDAGGGQQYRLPLATPQAVLIQACGYAAGNYSFNVTLLAGLAPISGFDEQELNDDEAHATPVPADHYAEGLLDAAWKDVDYWSYDPPASGWVAVSWGGVYYSPSNLLTVWNSSGEVPAVSSYWGVAYNATAGETVFLRWEATSSTGYYFRIKFANDLSHLAPRTDDVEPNDDAASAQIVVAGLNATVFVDPGFDPYDYFRVDGRAGDRVRIAVMPFDSVYTPSFRINVTAAAGPLRFPEIDSQWFSYTSAWSTGLLQEDASIVFRVTALDWFPAKLTVSVSIAHLAVMDDGTLTLPELMSAFDWGPELSPNWAGYRAPYGTAYNLTNGMGWLFGPSFCFLGAGFSNDLHDVLVEQGQVFRETGFSGNPGHVATRTLRLNITAWMATEYQPWICFEGMAVDYLGATARGGSGYRWLGAEHLVGNRSLVIDEIALRGADNASGQLAMWAASLFFNETRARELGADNAILTEARDILRSAGVKTCLNGLVDPRCDGISWTPSPPSAWCNPINVTRTADRPVDNASANITGPGDSAGGAISPTPRPLGAAEGAAIGAVAGVGVAGAVAFALLSSRPLAARPPKRPR